MAINIVKTKQEADKQFEVCNSLLLKYWPAVCVVSDTPWGLSQHDIKKAALYRYTFRRNSNEPQRLSEEGMDASVLWSGSATDEAKNQQTQRSR